MAAVAGSTGEAYKGAFKKFKPAFKWWQEFPRQETWFGTVHLISLKAKNEIILPNIGKYWAKSYYDLR